MAGGISTLVSKFNYAHSQPQAFLAMQKQISGTSLMYIAFNETMEESSFVQSVLEEQLVSSYLSGREALPGGEKIPQQVPEDLMEGLPPAPTLNKLVMLGDENNKTLGLPIKLLEDPHLHLYIDSPFGFLVVHNSVCPLTRPSFTF